VDYRAGPLGHFDGVDMDAVADVDAGEADHQPLRDVVDRAQHLDPVPRATVETMRENKEWAKEQLR